MAVLGLAVGLPFLMLLILFVGGPYLYRWGVNQTRNRRRAMMTAALQGWDLAFRPELNAAVEYQKVCHDEEDGEGRNNRPHFPGVAGDGVAVRPLQDTPEEMAVLAAWTAPGTDLAVVRKAFLTDLPENVVPCMALVDGCPTGYLHFTRLTEEPAFRISRVLGEANPRALRLLLAYLFELEGAARVIQPDATEATPATVVPSDCQFRLILTNA